MRTYDIYARFTVQAESHDDALDKWDEDKAVFREWTDIIEVME